MGESLDELAAMETVFKALEPLDEGGRVRVVAWVIGALGVQVPQMGGETSAALAVDPETGDGIFMRGVGGLSAKQFMARKSPRTAVERVACLAYFLAYGKDTPHFKTKDLSEMNVEAAGASFSNISQAAKDAVKGQLMAPAGKGARQLTVLGDEVVEALPDRARVKEALSRGRERSARRPRRSTVRKTD